MAAKLVLRAAAAMKPPRAAACGGRQGVALCVWREDPQRQWLLPLAVHCPQAATPEVSAHACQHAELMHAAAGIAQAQHHTISVRKHAECCGAPVMKTVAPLKAALTEMRPWPSWLQWWLSRVQGGMGHSWPPLS